VVAQSLPAADPAADLTADHVLFARSDDPARDLGLLAASRNGTDSLPFPVVGITGTNGKTTITYLLEHLFRANGKNAGVLGTVSYRWPGYEEAAPLTTPDLLSLHDMLSRMRLADVEAVFMEVSSHALGQQRVAGIPFAGAVFTNLTQDHLDYHQTMDRYFEAKARLFSLVREGGVMVANSDDQWGRRLLADHPQAIGYGLRPCADVSNRMLHGTITASSPQGLRLRLEWEGRTWEIDSPLVGEHNALNLLAVQAFGLGFGMMPEQLDCFSNFYGVSGRLERVQAKRGGQDLHVFVDYAHTPDALVNVLQALRGAGFGRIVTVFGCGGDRDRTKRPLMGEAVARLSDVAVLTSDNPRHEEPLAIMADVMPGLERGAAERGEDAPLKIVAEADRHKAIKLALELAKPGDAVLIAGKGHEPYQQIGDVKHPFSDQDVVRELTCA